MNPLEVRLIFADDDQLVQELFLKAFEQAGGPGYATFQSCENALSLMRWARTYRRRVFLYVLDSQLPGRSGKRHLVRQLRRYSPHAIILVRSSRTLKAYWAKDGGSQLFKGKGAEGVVRDLSSLIARSLSTAASTRCKAVSLRPVQPLLPAPAAASIA